VPEQYNFHDNSLPNMWNPIVVRNNPANYKSVVSITNNSMINDPSGFWNNSITMLFSGTADSGESTYTITNNVFNNTYGFPIGAGNYHQGGGTPPTLTIRATGNKMKNVGVPWGVVNEQPGSNYQVVNFLATNNCVQNSGLWAPFSGFNIGQMIFGDYGFGSSALTSNINVHQNYFLNPIQGNVGFGPIDLIVSAGWAADLASNYWADGCPNCVPRDFVGFGAGTITGSGTFLTTGPTTCNVPDYVPFALQGRKNKMSISKAQQIYEAPQPLWGRTLNQIPSWNGSSQKS
jgi:hypothetical protein